MRFSRAWLGGGERIVKKKKKKDSLDPNLLFKVEHQTKKRVQESAFLGQISQLSLVLPFSWGKRQPFYIIVVSQSWFDLLVLILSLCCVSLISLLRCLQLVQWMKLLSVPHVWAKYLLVLLPIPYGKGLETREHVSVLVHKAAITK